MSTQENPTCAKVSLHPSPNDPARVLCLGRFSDRPFHEGNIEPDLLDSLGPWLKLEEWGRSGRRLEGEAGGIRWVLHGLGSRGDFDDDSLVEWFAKAVKRLFTDGHSSVAFSLPFPEDISPAVTGRIVRTLALSGYRFDRYRKKEDAPSHGQAVELWIEAERREVWEQGIQTGRENALGAAWSRDFGNTPPNVAHPEWMAHQAVEAGEAAGFETQVIEGEELERRGFGGLLAVGRGSRNPPRLVRLSRERPGRPVVALVGKGVTFDTGGISLKPGASMDEMKFDKCGACTLMGLVRSLAGLDLEVGLRIYLPLAENMPDGAAYRPGDIITPYGGPTVEVLNTDAEGRLILADALSLAAEEGADTIVEVSTLTGACVVALGFAGAGLWSPSDDLAEELLGAASLEGENLWRLPLWKSFDKAIEGQHGDLKNIAGRWGGANVAAAFLGRFTGDVKRWAHMDIAGAAWKPREAKDEFGATGYGVATLRRWLKGQGLRP